jgi:hypothetical protein
MKILYKFPTRSRPDRFFKCLDNMAWMMTHDNYAIEVTADWDDETMNKPEIVERVGTYKNTRIHFGSSANKVDAINRDMPLFTDWDILILMSDDMEFISHGFDTQILSDYKLYPGGDILMHYPDH